MDIRTDIEGRQQDMLKDRQGGALAELRQARDAEYSALLATQREERDDLRARQAGIPPGVHETEKQLNDKNLRQLVEWQRSTTPLPEFRAAAEDIHVREAPSGQAPGRYVGVGEEWPDPAPHAHQASGPKMRDPADIGVGLGLGALGGLATLTERFFDGFFDQPVTPAERQARQQPTPAPQNEEPRANPFEAVAEHARRLAEQEEDDRRRNEWWDERRSRARDA